MEICEKDVSRLWQEGRFSRLRDEDGNEVEVIYGGRPAAGPGRDFQDAVLRFNGQKCCGDVEIHVGSDLWKKHGHDRNPVYINVILHVAMWEKGGLPALARDGSKVPTVILSSAPARFAVQRQGCPQAGRLGSGKLGSIVSACGLERLSGKAQEFAGLAGKLGPQQALYLGFCRSLGYSRNKVPMARLAGLLPYEWWQIRQDRSPDLKLSVALGKAGLLGPQPLPEGENMQRSEWCFSAVRPANSPLRRVAALCGLMGKGDALSLRALRDLIANTGKGRAAAELEARLLVGEHGYWACHYDFGRPLRWPMSLLGRGRAREIVVNSILPFFLAHGQATGDDELAQSAAGLYSCYPALPENEITGYMQHLLWPGGRQEGGACRQQGLLHIFHTYCRVRDCRQCPLAKRRKPGWGPHRAGRRRNGLT